MKLTETAIYGAWLIEPQPVGDERGSFARTWDPKVFARYGLDTDVAQCSLSQNRRRGTLRGLHFQRRPFEETKLVRCTSGAIFDVCVDLRPDSPSFCRWIGLELSRTNGWALFIPKGCAHGFLTLADDSDVTYQMSQDYEPDAAGGVRWDDRAFSIRWPAPVVVINDRDRSWPPFVPAIMDTA